MNSLRQAFSFDPKNDTQVYPQGIASFNKKRTIFNRLLPYGICSLEPKGTFILLLNQDAVKFGIPSAMQARFKNLKEGEVAVYNTKTEKYIYLKSDGTIEVQGDLKILNNLEIEGNLTVTGEATIGEINFSTHIHYLGTNPTTGPQNP